MEYYCQSCSASIPLEDINVAADIALCRKCGAINSFAALRTATTDTTLLSKPPPKGVKVERDMMGNGTVITYRRIPVGFLFFFIPFTALWSGGSMYGIYGTQIIKGEFDLQQSLFGIPFLIGTIVLVFILLFCLFGKWTIRLDRGNGTVFVGVGILGWKRKFTYNLSSTVRIAEDSNIRVNRQPLRSITVKTDNKQFAFGGFIRDDAKEFIAATLTRELRR